MSIKSVLKSITASISEYDIVILSDYGKGVLTDKLCQEVIQISNDNNVRVLVDPKGSDFSKYKGSYLLTPSVVAPGIQVQHHTSHPGNGSHGQSPFAPAF